MATPVILRTALGKSPLVRALKEGAVASDRVRFDFVEVEPVTRAFRRMPRDWNSTCARSPSPRMRRRGPTASRSPRCRWCCCADCTMAR